MAAASESSADRSWTSGAAARSMALRRATIPGAAILGPPSAGCRLPGRHSAGCQSAAGVLGQPASADEIALEPRGEVVRVEHPNVRAVDRLGLSPVESRGIAGDPGAVEGGDQFGRA